MLDGVVACPSLGISETEAMAVARSEFGVVGRAERIPGEGDDNFRIVADAGDYSLKISNPAEGPAVLEMQQLALEFLAEVDPTLPIPRVIRTVRGEPIATLRLRFAKSGYYFSTFAGNPVAMAAGMAVLNVLERDGLARRAARMGQYIRERLEAIGHPKIANVAGSGLFIGVELRDTSGHPDGSTAERIADAMRDCGVLIGRTGHHGNVLKICLPLVFETEHADLLVEPLRDVLERC